MPEKENQSNPIEEMRERAEKIARAKGGHANLKLEDLSREETVNILHELQVHQIELELQNEELRRTQEALESSRAQYLDLYDLAPVGYLTIDKKDLIQQVNLTAANMLGVTRKALINKPLTRFILPEDLDIFYFMHKSLFDTGMPRECELRMVKADNASLWVRLDATVGQDSEGLPLARLSISDISDLKKNQQQLADYSEQLEEKVSERTRELRESQEKLVRQERLAALGQLAGGVGHELRNPLGVISNSIYILGETLPQADKKTREYLGIITDELHRAEKIITDLLDFAKIRKLEKQAIPLDTMVCEALARFKAPDIVKVNVDIEDALPQVFADPGQMSQVLGNLLLNAYQAMPDGGELKLAGKLKDHNGQSYLILEVEDSGCGISPENMAKLFEPLFTTKPRGIGLGLATSKTLIESNGGRLEVSSQFGKGSVFTIYLPFVQE